MIARVKPFLSIYHGLCDQHLTAFLSWHKSLLKLNHVFSSILKELSTDGFCRPAESDGKNGADDTSDGKTTEGTGMAEGTGAKNVSDEIEDESQLEGLQSDVPQDKREDEEPEDGDDNAVEMQMDFEGDLEDRGDGDKESGDEEDEDQDADQEEPEEQVADVDPLDPSSIDEKMWGDDEPPSEEKDGKTDEVNQETAQTTGEAEMGAKEDDQSASKPKGDEAGETAEQDPKETDKPEPGEQPEDGATGEEQEPEQGDEDQQAEDADEQQADEQTGDRIDQPIDESDRLDLPDDMKLDQEDDKGSTGGDDVDDGDLDLPDELPDMQESALRFP